MFDLLRGRRSREDLSETSRHIRLYSSAYCGYCRRAEQLLNKLQVPYELIDVTSDRPARAWLVEATGRHTVPQIFIDETPIGGFTDLRALHRSGELARMLNGPETPVSGAPRP